MMYNLTFMLRNGSVRIFNPDSYFFEWSFPNYAELDSKFELFDSKIKEAYVKVMEVMEGDGVSRRAAHEAICRYLKNALGVFSDHV